MVFFRLLTICFINIHNIYGLGGLYKVVHTAAKCGEIEQKKNLSDMECIMVCERKGMEGSRNNGQCVCLDQSCVPQNQQQLIKMFKRITSHNTNGCNDGEVYIYGLVGGKGACRSNPAKSCKEIKDLNTNLNSSGFYWIQLNKAINVYCDMATDGGGWMMIGNITSGPDDVHSNLKSSYLFDHSNGTVLEALGQVRYGKFLLSGTKFKELDGYINIKQFRVFCTKPYIGRTYHMMSNANPSGDLFKKYLFENISMWLNNGGTKCSETFSRLDDDNSLLAQRCLNNDAVSGDWDGEGARLYGHFMFRTNIHYLLIRYPHVSCDDHNTDVGYERNGVWHYFVR